MGIKGGTAMKKEFGLKELAKDALFYFEANHKTRVVFYKEHGKWYAYRFCLPIQKNHIDILKCIKETDSKAIVMSRKKFIADWKNTLVSLDVMVSQIEIEHEQQQRNCNICNFLKAFECEQQQQILPFDKQQFLQSEWGQCFLDSVKTAYYSYKNEKPDREYWLMIAGVTLLPLSHIYDMDYQINMNDEGYKIVSLDEKDVLFQFQEIQ